jgi:hypothetical protein
VETLTAVVPKCKSIVSRSNNMGGSTEVFPFPHLRPGCFRPLSLCLPISRASLSTLSCGPGVQRIRGTTAMSMTLVFTAEPITYVRLLKYGWPCLNILIQAPAGMGLITQGRKREGFPPAFCTWNRDHHKSTHG